MLGSGGREHALAWKLAQSPKLEKLYVAPGNAGTAKLAENVAIGVMDFDALTEFAVKNGIDLIVVVPDDPLAAGAVDHFTKAGLRAFGPPQAAAELEASKIFSKQLMHQQNVPTANFQTFTESKSALKYVKESWAGPVAVKASGLALGKGVFICSSQVEAEQAIHILMEEAKLGEAGQSIVVEELLDGQEVSTHAFCDGTSAILFPSSQDHKRIGDKDTGPNTGGMGAYAPVPWVKSELMEDAKALAVDPILNGLAEMGREFRGCLYPGLMITSEGLKVLEYNARFGDPETQVYMPLLKTDLLDIFNACIDGKLSQVKIEWEPKTAVCVVLASEGYPGAVKKGRVINGLETAAAMPDVLVFHAGTKVIDGNYVTSGGRVLGVTAVGRDLNDARDKAYAAVSQINFEGMQYRTDIGLKGLEYSTS